MFLFHLHDHAINIRRNPGERSGKPISMSSSVLKITATSLSMSIPVLDLRLMLRKTFKPSGTSSYTALTQAAFLQKDYMLSGNVVYFCDVNCLILLIATDVGYVSQRPTLLMGGSEMELKKFWA